MRLLLISGPPRAGKTNFAQAAWGAAMSLPIVHGDNPFCRARVMPLADELKWRTHCMYGHPAWGPDHFEPTKDLHEDTFGMSPRQAYVEAFNRYWKPVHGPGTLGWWLNGKVRALGKRQPRLLIVPDLGRQEDFDSLVAGLDVERIVHVQAHRPGTQFTDSREPVSLMWPTPSTDPRMTELALHNENTLEDWRSLARDHAIRLLGEPWEETT